MGLKLLKNWRSYALTGVVLLGAEFAVAAVSAVKASSDATNTYYQFQYTDSPTFLHVFLDTDQSASSGFKISGRGADYLLQNTSLYRYSGSNGAWGWSYVKTVPMSKVNYIAKWTVARTDLKSPASLSYLAQSIKPSATSAVYQLALTASTPVAPTVSLAVQGAPNLPLNGTTTLVTVGLVSGTPTKVELSRDGFAPFATYPTDTFFKLSADGKSLTGNWCISSSCWRYQAGAHVLNVVATYANGQTSKASVNLNVVDAVVPPVSSCTFNGQTIASGSSVTGYLATSVAFGSTCTSQTRTCSNGTLSGSYQYSSCSVGSAPPPPPPPPPTQEPTGPTFYISPSGNDANAGTQSAPWRTIKKAALVVNPGDTVILMNGTYEQNEIAFRRSGTAAKRITIKAQNKWQANVSTIAGCHPSFSIYASYITVKDIRFTVSPSNQCSTYTSANVAIRAWNSVVAKPSNPTTGHVGFRADGIKIEGGLKRDLAFKSNQDFTIFENSEADSDVELFGAKDSIIRNSLITGQDKFGISILVKGGARNNQVYGNVIRNKVPNGQAIIIGGYSCDACHYDTSTNIEAYNTVAYNNIIINESTGSMAGLMFQGAKDSAFFNNVVIGGMIAMTVGGHNSGPQAPTSNPTFKNNIVICNGASLTSGYHGWSGTGAISVDYNLFHNCSGAPAQAHTISGDPKFVSTTSDWRLQAGSPAINSGIPVSFPAYGGGSLDISRDKNGVVRSTPWDLGVYNTP